MLPVYALYFAGEQEERGKATVLKNALFFALGFTVVFTLMGALAGVIGSFLVRYQRVLDIITGAVVVFFGLSFIGLFELKFMKAMHIDLGERKAGPASSFLFGLVFSLAWTPCVGAFLGSALMLASQQGSVLLGTALLLSYSLGLAIPFVIFAFFIGKLRKVITAVSRRGKLINIVAGALLVVFGVLMMTGLFNKLLAAIS